jgi:uncharacterized cupin superfamily protein
MTDHQPRRAPSTVPAATADLSRLDLDAEQVVAGNPQVSGLEVAAGHGWEAGVWQHTAGVSTDVEADEVFVVLSGRATVEVIGGPTLEVGPGDIGVLNAGDRTTWTVHETLRKVYFLHP